MVKRSRIRLSNYASAGVGIMEGVSVPLWASGVFYDFYTRAALRFTLGCHRVAPLGRRAEDVPGIRLPE